MTKVVNRIFEETDTRKFELLRFNRSIKKRKKLMASMVKHGWLDAFPMKVRVNGSGKLVVEDGHHRFEIAQELGIGFKYVICRDDATIYEIDAAVNKWTLEDFLTSHCRCSNEHYHFLAKFCEDTGISISDASSMMVGNSAGSSSHIEKFKKGDFTVTAMNNANNVKALVMHCKKHGIKWAHHHNLVLALSKVSWVDEFSVTRMKAKIKAFPYLVKKQPSLATYVELLDLIYNFKSTDKIPLKFLADQAARERAVA
jgi:hypothetical protein